MIPMSHQKTPDRVRRSRRENQDAQVWNREEKNRRGNVCPLTICCQKIHEIVQEDASSNRVVAQNVGFYFILDYFILK